jgi:hypothetical protein
MKPAPIIGAILIVLGIVGFAAGGVSFTHQKKDVDAGPIQISHQEAMDRPQRTRALRHFSYLGRS